MEGKKTSRKNAPMSDTARALLDRARHYCALSEQCESGVRQKLISWGAASDEVEAIVARLRDDDYLNDVRYARVFGEGKLIGQRWGRQKVLYHMRTKHLSQEAIEAGMSVIDDETYFSILEEECAKKLHTLGDELTVDVRRRMYSFLSSRGYTVAEIARVIDMN